MRDCESIQDLLPDLVAGRLDADEASRVTAHVDGCPACAAELAVVRAARAAFARSAPAVDVARIVSALPTPVVPLASRRQRRTRWASWKIAATIATIAVGGLSIGVLQGVLRDNEKSPHTRSVEQGKNIDVSEASGLSVGGNLNDLSDEDMQTLLDKIDQLDAVPSADPQPAVSGLRAAAGVQ